MQDNLISLVDMDGTLCDYDSAMMRDLNRLKSSEESVVQDLWDERLPHLKERMSLIKRQPNWWRNLEPIISGMRMVHLLDELGFKIHILTQGPATTTSAWTEKVEWCQKHLCHIDYDITITRNKGLVYGKVLVDDYPEYIMKWLKWRPRGLVIMPAKSYNSYVDHPNVFHYAGPESMEGAKNLLLGIKERAMKQVEEE
jgi:5'(3')-deoxyribonucleotidase